MILCIKSTQIRFLCPTLEFLLFSGCGENITSFGGGGLLKSPDYPEKYKSYTYCQWIIKASNRNNKILVGFDCFHLESKDEGKGKHLKNNFDFLLSKTTSVV